MPGQKELKISAGFHIDWSMLISCVDAIKGINIVSSASIELKAPNYLF